MFSKIVITAIAFSTGSAFAAPATVAIPAATTAVISNAASLATQAFGANSTLIAALSGITDHAQKSASARNTLDTNASTIESIMKQVVAAKNGKSSSPKAKEFADLLSKQPALVEAYILGKVELASLGLYGAQTTVAGEKIQIQSPIITAITVDYFTGDASDRKSGLVDDMTAWDRETVVAARSKGQYGNGAAEIYKTTLKSKWSDQEIKKASGNMEKARASMSARLAAFLKAGC